MTKPGLILTLATFATIVVAQEAAKPTAPQVARTNLVQRAEAPTENDMYCSGMVSQQALPANSYIAAGWDTPFQTRFSGQDYIYLTGGSYDKDQRYHIVRPVRDTNRYQMYSGQHHNLRAAGTVYQELGRVRVIEVQKGIGIAQIEFSCDGFIPGDLAVPWQERPTPQFRRLTSFDRFAAPNGKQTGMIIGGKDFDTLSADRGRIYINVGANQGIKAGDYVRVTRTYEQLAANEADGLSLKASEVEPMVVQGPKFHKSRFGDLPRKSIGEAMVLYTTPTTATAYVTRSLEQLQVGDGIELEDELPPLPPPAPEVQNPPTISCVATPATIRVGESANIRCTGASPDERPLNYTFTADGGQLNARGETATLDARNARPGVVSVMTTVADDRGLSANTVTRVNVESAQAIEPANLGNFGFKTNSAYVDNQAKAFLDDVALRLQREAGSNVMLVGFTQDPEATRLGITRANNAKTYLTRDKGVDPGRVMTTEGGRGGHKVEVWFVPAGAAMPTITPNPGTSN
jgi:outer membrane protein OmpA-like peptidoglycan-associated protein